jgi:hypothetical protein
MNEARFGPFHIIIYVVSSMFSPPPSPHIRDGNPYISTAFKNTSSTIDAQLLELARISATL